MLTKKQKLDYLFSSMVNIAQDVRCTYCGSTDCITIDRKYFVTRLMECLQCHLYFRHPVDRQDENDKYYQTEYKESDHVTTDLPTMDLLEKLKKENFNSVSKNAGRFLDLFKRLFPLESSLKIVDYGCSWGYLTYQFQEAGHQTQGFEISRSRADFGNKNLGLQIVTDEKSLRGGNDIFFSSHVIEHHPDIKAMLKLAKSLVLPGGYFIAFCPNGSPAFRALHPEAFHRFWGKVHPNFLNAEFFQNIFRDRPYLIGASSVERNHIRPLDSGDQIVDPLTGEELMVIARF